MSCILTKARPPNLAHCAQRCATRAYPRACPRAAPLDKGGRSSPSRDGRRAILFAPPRAIWRSRSSTTRNLPQETQP
eukprot:219286-Pyramimonas_sp.AAC.1